MSYSNALDRGANVLIGYVFGAVYLLVGLLGFTVSGGHDFAGMRRRQAARPVHGQPAAQRRAPAHRRAAGAGARPAARRWPAGSTPLVGGVYLLLGLVGLFILTNDVNILALNTPDNVLHFGSAAILLGVGLCRPAAAPARHGLGATAPRRRSGHRRRGA